MTVEQDALEAATSEVRRRRQDIARTRQQLSRSIDALSYKLSPDTVRAEAVEGALTMANGAKTSLIETLRENPIPSAMVAGGLYMLFRKRSASGSMTQNPSSVRPGYGPNTYATGGYDSGADNRQIRGAVDSAMGQGRAAVDTIGDTAGEVGERVQEAAGQVTDRAQELTGQAQSTAQDTVARLQDMARQNPVGAAVAVAGLGAAIGMLLPRTAKEDQIMGDARDQLAEQASQKVQEVGDKVQKVVEASANTARQEAVAQDLTPQPSSR